MNHWYIDLKVETERHKDEARRAAEYRLVREASRHRSNSPTRIAFYWRWLARLGALLTSWGCRLQTRAADATINGLSAFSGPSSTEPCSG